MEDFQNSAEWKKLIGDIIPISKNEIKISRKIEPAISNKSPDMYNVVMLNDDYTPMDFVISVVQKFFHLTLEQATDVMLDVHKKGNASCGYFTKEIAETKVIQVIEYARKNKYPLKCIMQKSKNNVIKKS